MAISSSVDLRALPSVSFAPLSAADIEASILTTYVSIHAPAWGATVSMFYPVDSRD